MTYPGGDEVRIGDVVNIAHQGCTQVVKKIFESAPESVLVEPFGAPVRIMACTLVRRADKPEPAPLPPETPWGDYVNDPINVLIMQAATGRRGPDQQRIAAKFRELTALCLQKNHDYGSTFARPPCLAPNVHASEAVLVRMSDKIGRLQTLLSGERAYIQESLRDTIRDLSVYGILWEIAVEMENAQEAK